MRKTWKMYAVALPLFAVLLLNVAYAQSVNSGSTGGAPTGSGALSLQGLTISPQNVQAGENITISFQLFNSYSGTLNNVNLELESSNPLLNVSPSFSNLIDVIGSGTYGGSGFDIYTYHVRVPSTLESGIYTIDVVATYETSVSDGITSYDTPGESIMPINIYVHGHPSIGFNIMPEAQITPNTDTGFQIDATNSGTGTAYNASATFLNSTYFKPSGSEFFDIGTLSPGAASSGSVDMFVARNITNGSHSIRMRLSYQDENGTRLSYNESVPISVLLNTPDVIAVLQSTSPSQLYIGSNQSVSISIENVGSGTARNVSVAFNGGPGIILGSSASRFFISSLQPGQSAIEQVEVNSNQSLPVSTSNIYAAISYEAANYAGNYSKISSIPLSIFPSAEFNVTSTSGNLQPGSTYKPITYVIKNIGNEPATQISLSLQSIYPITPISGNAYIERLAPNQSATVTFYVDVDSNGAAGSYPVTIYEQWRQPNGAISQQFSGSSSYYTDVGGAGLSTPSQPSTAKSANGAYSYAYAAIVIVVIVVILLLARKRITRMAPRHAGDSAEHGENGNHAQARRRK